MTIQEHSDNCCRKGPLIIIKSPSLLLVLSRAGKPGPACQSRWWSAVRSESPWPPAGASHWNGPVTWQARGLWPPGPGQSAVAQIGRVGPGPGISWWRSAGAWTRQAQSPGRLTAYGVGLCRSVTLCLKRHGHVSSFMCITLCVSGIWVSSWLTSLVIS
jgi:hypothetical protein